MHYIHRNYICMGLTGCSAMNCCSGIRSSVSERTFLADGGAKSGLISGAMLIGGNGCKPPTTGI